MYYKKTPGSNCRAFFFIVGFKHLYIYIENHHPQNLVKGKYFEFLL